MNVGAFSTPLTGPPAFAWTNPNLKTVVRNQGLTITWAGGGAGDMVDISGYSNGNPVMINGKSVAVNTYTQFECLAPATPGTFKVPPSVLLALPAVSGTSPNGSVFVYLSSGTRALNIPGTDFGFAAWTSSTVGASVPYQ